MSDFRPEQPATNLARRHVLAIAAATTGKIAAFAALASTMLPSAAAEAKNGGNGNGGNGNGARCLLKGTHILTPRGGIPVEDLRIGDLVETARGEALPIKWIGRQTFRKSGVSWHRDVQPIRISRFALDERTPHADLYVSPRHAMLIDGLFVCAIDLINKVTISSGLPSGLEKLEYFHLLLDTHEIIFTEGAPSGTMLLRNRNEHEFFDNFAEFGRLYPTQRQKKMMRAAPHYSGWAHIAGLLKFGASQVIDVRDEYQKAYTRIAARAGERVS